MNRPGTVLLLLTALFCTLTAPVMAQEEGPLAFSGARIIDGTAAPPISDGVLIVRDGRIERIGGRGEVSIPEDARVIDVSGSTLIPGLINTHGHVGDVRGLESGHYNRDNLIRQLSLYARYGITTVASLGGDRSEGFTLRSEQDTPQLQRARLYVAGPVISADTPEQAVQEVDEVAERNPDFIKIRVDDFLGRGSKMPPEIYRAISERADEHGIPLAVHTYYLDDTRALLREGADFVAHSVRDAHVEQEFIELIRERNACYTPTLTRELSTFVYEQEPDFFSDPFFLREVDQQVLDTLTDPERQQRLRESESAQTYKEALPVAMDNLKTLADAGVRIAMGTDSGPAGRFQGYFEHLEMSMMADAGLSPEQILHSATGEAADCLGLEETGTLEPGNWADLVVLEENPLEDIHNTRSIQQVWIAGNRIDREGQGNALERQEGQGP